MDPADQIRGSLRDFLKARSRGRLKFNDGTHLFYDLGLKSEDGVYFVLELCDVFEFEFPLDFNPFVNADETKIIRVGEMISRVQQMLAEQEQTSEAR